MQVRQISVPPGQADLSAANASAASEPRPAAPAGGVSLSSWNHVTFQAVASRVTQPQVTQAFQEFASGLTRELEATQDLPAEAFARIGSLQTSFQHALSTTRSLQSHDRLQPLQ